MACCISSGIGTSFGLLIPGYLQALIILNFFPIIASKIFNFGFVICDLVLARLASWYITQISVGCFLLAVLCITAVVCGARPVSVR